MPNFLISGPNGQQYRVTGPEGSSEQDAMQMLQRQMVGLPRLREAFASGDLQRQQKAQAAQRPPGATVYSFRPDGPPHPRANGTAPGGQGGAPPIADPPMDDGDGGVPFN